MQPPGRERPPSSSLSPQGLRLTIQDDDGGESETTKSTALVSPLENDDLVADSLLRLPALPSSLFRASVVCKRWSRVVSNPSFLREFRAHHWKPPLLGLFCCLPRRIFFTPMLDPPDEIPAGRFALKVPLTTALLCCHHGRVLMHDVVEHQFTVWEPVTGEVCHISKPPSSFVPNKSTFTNAAVLCASADKDHVHGACHSDPFKVVVVAGDNKQCYGFVYSSETRAWGNFFSMMWPPHIRMVHGTCGSQLFKNSICLLLLGEKLAILEFDWAKQSLAVIDVPYALDWHNFMSGRTQFLIKPSDAGGDLSFVVKEVFTVHVWKRTSTDSNGVATWMLGNTIELNSALSLGPPADLKMHIVIMESDDDGNVLFKTSNSSDVFMVNIESSKVKKLPKPFPFHSGGHPFSSFYTPGMHVNTGRRDDGVDKIPGE